MKKHIIISGKVQGVGFRYWLYKAAIQRKIDGNNFEKEELLDVKFVPLLNNSVQHLI